MKHVLRMEQALVWIISNIFYSYCHPHKQIYQRSLVRGKWFFVSLTNPTQTWLDRKLKTQMCLTVQPWS